jgi:hypothetical protein
MTTLSTNLLGRKLFAHISSDKEVNDSFSGMTLRQFLNETGNSHLFIKKDWNGCYQYLVRTKWVNAYFL